MNDIASIERTRRLERSRDRFAQTLDRENRTDARGHLVSLGFLERLHKRAEWAEQAMDWLREQKCPSCIAGSEDARTCTSYGSADLFRGEPMCRWATQAAVERRDHDLTTERLRRLLDAGCGDPDARRLVPAARRGQPPLPDAALFPSDRRTELMAGPIEATDAAEAFIADPRLLTLVLIGGNGVGKTIAASHVVACEGREALWVQASIWDSYARLNDLRERLETCALLVVDELGREAIQAPPELGSNGLFATLLERKNRGLRTVTTTNLTAEQLLQRGGQSWVDKLDQDGLVAECGQASLRRYLRVSP